MFYQHIFELVNMPEWKTVPWDIWVEVLDMLPYGEAGTFIQIQQNSNGDYQDKYLRHVIPGLVTTEQLTTTHQLTRLGYDPRFLKKRVQFRSSGSFQPQRLLHLTLTLATRLDGTSWRYLAPLNRKSEARVIRLLHLGIPVSEVEYVRQEISQKTGFESLMTLLTSGFTWINLLRMKQKGISINATLCQRLLKALDTGRSPGIIVRSAW